MIDSVKMATIVGCLPIRLPTFSGRNCTHFCKDTLVPMRGKRTSVAVSSKQFTGFCAAAHSGVNCQPTLASGTVSSSATHAGKRTVFGPTCSNSSRKTRTWQRSCMTVQLFAPLCAPRAVPKKGASERAVPRTEPRWLQQQDSSPRRCAWLPLTVHLDRWRAP